MPLLNIPQILRIIFQLLNILAPLPNPRQQSILLQRSLMSLLAEQLPVLELRIEMQWLCLELSSLIESLQL